VRSADLGGRAPEGVENVRAESGRLSCAKRGVDWGELHFEVRGGGAGGLVNGLVVLVVVVESGCVLWYA
jgi:hypothetical protein